MLTIACPNALKDAVQFSSFCQFSYTSILSWSCLKLKLASRRLHIISNALWLRYNYCDYYNTIFNVSYNRQKRRLHLKWKIMTILWTARSVSHIPNSEPVLQVYTAVNQLLQKVDLTTPQRQRRTSEPTLMLGCYFAPLDHLTVGAKHPIYRGLWQSKNIRQKASTI